VSKQICKMNNYKIIKIWTNNSNCLIIKIRIINLLENLFILIDKKFRNIIK